MKQSYQKLLRQLSQMAAEGRFKDAADATQKVYAELPNDDAIMLQVILDFLQGNASHAAPIAQMRDIVCQLLIASYRESSRKDQAVAEAFFGSFLSDYPGVAESALLPRWSSLATASLALREVINSGNRLLLWQQASRLVLMSNEFVAGLLPYLIITWRVVNNKPYSTSVFTQPFGGLVNQFRDLTGGDDSPFAPILFVARPKIRNAIAHGGAQLDSDDGKVRYTDGRKEKREYEIDIADFMDITMAGSHLTQPYLAALAVIAVMRFGSPEAKAVVPTTWANAFSAPSPS